MPEFNHQELFEFLFPRGAQVPRYRLFSPDLVELRWSVWDHLEARTLSYGVTPEDAAQSALDAVRRNLPPLR